MIIFDAECFSKGHVLDGLKVREVSLYLFHIRIYYVY